MTSDTDDSYPAQGQAAAAARKAAKAAARAAGAPVAGLPPVPDEAEEGPGPLKLRDVLDAVAERSEAKRGDAKPVIEAALAVIGEALSAERDLSLPGFGKLKIKRSKTAGDRRVIEARIRQDSAPADAGSVGNDGVAEQDD
jgi:hypothetical protein